MILIVLANSLVLLLSLLTGKALCLPYDEEQFLWNLNQNQTATDPIDYWGKWENHSQICPQINDCHALTDP